MLDSPGIVVDRIVPIMNRFLFHYSWLSRLGAEVRYASGI